MAVIVDQKRLGGGSHSTVGTTTDIYTLLRLLFSRVGKPHVGYSNAFSFNDPEGMCRDCNGLGKKLGVMYDDFIDMSKSLAEGAVQVPFFASWESAAYAASGLFDKNKKLSKFTREEMDLLLYSKPRKVKMRFADSTINVTFMGIVEKIEKAYIKRDHQDAVRADAEGGGAVSAAAAVPDVQGRAPQPGGAQLQDRRPQHRRALRHGDRRPDARHPIDQRVRSPRRSSPRSSSACSTSSTSASTT